MVFRVVCTVWGTEQQQAVDLDSEQIVEAGDEGVSVLMNVSAHHKCKSSLYKGKVTATGAGAGIAIGAGAGTGTGVPCIRHRLSSSTTSTSTSSRCNIHACMHFTTYA
eukprot:1161488-Pelagomonas_calceolata.AAC.3